MDGTPITVYSDYICPFCFLGRRSLEEYQDRRDERLLIDWHPFDLQARKRGPDGEIDHSIEDGKGEAYYERARQNVNRLSEQYGVDMSLDVARDVDSLPAQVVSFHLKQTVSYEEWLAFDRGVFEALWTDGADIGDRSVLRDIASDVGLDPDIVDTALDDEELRADLRERFDTATEEGITGVPTFAYDGLTARGAVPPDHLERLVEDESGAP